MAETVSLHDAEVSDTPPSLLNTPRTLAHGSGLTHRYMNSYRKTAYSGGPSERSGELDQATSVAADDAAV
jgi:hypothetical protein